MYYVYLIQSLNHPNQRYIGYTKNIKARLKKHNEGGSYHTSKYKPWELIAYLGFKKESTAKAYEKYLKSGSGIASAQKRLWI